MVAISVRNVSKKYRLFASRSERLKEALHPWRRVYHREFWALKDVSFDVPKGQVIGIMGRNGSGKSTLLQIICGVLQPTHGEVVTNGRISALLELGAGFNPEFTGRENVVLNGILAGFTRAQMLERMAAIEDFADVGEYFDQPVKTYSSGMFVRVAFASAINIDPEILVVDEALSVGDAKFQHRCFQHIRRFMDAGKTIVAVSHSTDMLLRICQTGVVLDGGALRYQGAIKEAVNIYQDLLFGAPNSVGKEAVVAAEAKEGPGAPSKGAVAGNRLAVGALDGSDRDRVAEKGSYNRHETRLGSRAVTIIDYDIVADGRVNPPEVAPHTEVELAVKLKFHQDLERVSVGFAVVTIDGTYVYGTNMMMARQPLLSGSAGDVISVSLRFKAHLAGGEYFLNIGCDHILETGDGQFVDVRRSIARLKVAVTPGTVGVTDLGARFQPVRVSDHCRVLAS
jgi:lipopolysaccharide transport system ATP-binding protein